MTEYEVMEQETTMEPTDIYEGNVEEVETMSESGHGLGLLVGAGLVALTGAAAVGIKKLVDKKKNEPKKPKTKLKLVRVPVEEVEEEVEEVPYEEIVEDDIK